MARSARGRRWSVARLPLVIALALIAVAAPGCGSGDSDADRIRDTTRHFYTSIKDRDWNTACGDLTRAAQRALVEWGDESSVAYCGNVLGNWLGELGDFSRIDVDDIEVADVEVTGDRASAAVTPNLRDDRMVFAREDGKWRIASNGFDAENRARTALKGTRPAAASGEDQRIEVRSGFTRLPTGETSWGVRLRNPTREDAVDVEVRVTCKGDGGTAERTIHLIPAGTTAWVGGKTVTPDAVAGLDVAVHVARRARAGSVQVPRAGRISIVPAAGRGGRVRAVVDNVLDVPLTSTNAQMFAVLLDGTGQIMGGITGTLFGTVAADRRAFATFVGNAPVPGYTRAEFSLSAPTTP